MTQEEFRNIHACVFDAYGTLFDVHSPAARLRAELGEKADALSALWRTKQLEYTWLRSLMGRYADFWQVTGEALDYAMEASGVKDARLREELMEAYLSLEAYEDVGETLGKLKEAGMKTAILSNGSPHMLEAATRNARLESLLDAVLSVDEIGIYKPHPMAYRLAVERLGVRPDQVSFQSSNFWDAVGAKVFGYRVAWINRSQLMPEPLPAGPDAELKGLAELPRLLGL